MNPLQIQFERLRRGRWVVLAIMVLTTLGAVAFSLHQQTTYTARSTLTTSTINRSPDQDAYLAQGFAAYFNEKSYQERIASELEVPSSVTFSARTTANSPILYIEAVSIDRDVATDFATRLAETFRDETRGVAESARKQIITDIRRQADESRQRLHGFSSSAEERVVILQEIFDLERRATAKQEDDTNLLKYLQPAAGVAVNKPKPLLNGLLGLVGGLVLGCAYVLALATLKNRLSTPAEVQDRLGLDTLAVISDERVSVSGGPTSQAMMGLANQLTPEPSRRMTLAVTSPHSTAVRGQVAEGLVRFWAVQGLGSALVHADLREPSTAPEVGLLTVVKALSAGHDQLCGPEPGQWARIEGTDVLVVPGGKSSSDPYSLFSMQQTRNLFGKLIGWVGTAVIDTPPINEAAESQVICAAADYTLLVIEEGVTKAVDALRAVETLKRSGATVRGVVIARSFQWCDGVPVALSPSDLGDDEVINGLQPVEAEDHENDATAPAPEPVLSAQSSSNGKAHRPTPFPRDSMPASDNADG